MTRNAVTCAVTSHASFSGFPDALSSNFLFYGNKMFTFCSISLALCVYYNYDLRVNSQIVR